MVTQYTFFWFTVCPSVHPSVCLSLRAAQRCWFIVSYSFIITGSVALSCHLLVPTCVAVLQVGCGHVCGALLSTNGVTCVLDAATAASTCACARGCVHACFTTSRCHRGCLAGSSMLPFPLIINLLVVSSICVVHFSLFSSHLLIRPFSPPCSSRPALPYPALPHPKGCTHVSIVTCIE